ncbi:acyl-CoA dehydrogenase family protein [Streptomyces sp. NPDC001588]
MSRARAGGSPWPRRETSGLTLRSPGRFLAAADRLLDLWRAKGGPAWARDRVADALIGARAYQLFTCAGASRALEGEPMGPESSLNKVFWSEYDIALHETALDLLGAEGESAHGDWAEVQFGVPIGAFQAVKHRLADTKIALEFARPLVFGAALTMAPADVAAAKVAAGEAAYAAARTALQLHGAIGYTAEYDLSLWLTKARALRTAWGTPAECRAVVLSGARPRR